MARFAAIDVGSNAIRLRIVDDTTPFTEVQSMRVPVRLGTDVFTSGKLATAAIGQTCAAFRDFRRAIDAAGVDAYRATATSAVREAKNSATLVDRVRRECGIELEVIEGVEEARLIQLAVARRLALGNAVALLVDVGGGSTEFTLMRGTSTLGALSMPLGSVRLLETFLAGADRVSLRQRTLLDETIDRQFVEFTKAIAEVAVEHVIGTGGNVDSLADLCPRAAGVLECRAIDVAALGVLSDQLCTLTNAERRSTYNLRPDRADTIVPASRIFYRAARRFGAAAILAPGVGLKEGILLDLANRHHRVVDAGEAAAALDASCTRIGQRYQFDENHARLVAKHAVVIFDALSDVHKLDARDRLLLRAAALLHDVGDFVRYEGHHKHSFYLIQNSDILGLSSAERDVVAHVARYHRKGAPTLDHPAFRELEKDARSKVRALASMLRIADALDREHLGKIQAVRAIRRGNVLELHADGAAEFELEAWTLQAKSDFLRDVFELGVTLTREPESTAAPS